MNMRIFIICFILLALALPDKSYAQSNPEDSLIQVLEKASDDSSRIKSLLDLARYHGIYDRDKSIHYYSEVLQIEDDKYNSAVILDTMGLYSIHSGNYYEALDYLKQSLKLFIELKDSTWLGKVNNNIGVANWRLGNRNEALEFYQTGLYIREGIGDLRGVSTIQNNIGLIYQDWGLYDEAYTWHNKALEISLGLEDIDAISYSYSNLGRCFDNKKDYEKALYYHKLGYETLKIFEKAWDSYSYYFANIGDAYSEMGQTDSALYYYELSLIDAKKVNNKHRIATAEHNLGSIFLKMDKLDSARQLVNSSYLNSLENNYTELIIDNQFILAEIEKKRGHIPEAFEYYSRAVILKDSVINKEKLGKFTELQIQYNLTKEEQENAILRKNIEIQELIIRKQNNIKVIFVFGGLLILVILVYITRSRASFKKLSIQLQQSETELIKSNANKDKFFSIISHDLKSPFNALLGITNLLESKYDKLPSQKVKHYIKIQKDSTTNIYNLLEGLLQWAQTQSGRQQYHFEEIDFSQLCESVIGQLKAVALNKNIAVDNKVQANTIVFADSKALETVTRNIISNAIKFTDIEGRVVIEAERSGGEMIISITDSGVGISEEVRKTLFRIESQHSSTGTHNEKGTGLGLILCKDLIENQNGKIWVESEVGHGSKFMFSIPINSQDSNI
jgi:signal transduction histidine kinase